MAMLMHGVLPLDVDFKHNAAKYSQIEKRRDPEEVERARLAHVVAFFVPQGASGDTDLMTRLGTFYYQITVLHKRKAIVIISHADEISGDEDRKEILNEICQKLSIDSANVFFLENYVDTKDKQFHVDKAVLRILLAMISRADDFLTFDRLNPSPSPFPANPNSPNPSYRSDYTAKEPQSPSSKGKETASKSSAAKTTTQSPKAKKPPTPPPSDSGLEDFLEKLPEAFRSKLAGILQDEEIEDEETLRMMTPESWKSLGLKMGEIVKIQNALN